MIRWSLLIGTLWWIGATLVLADLRWFARRPLDERLLPYLPVGRRVRSTRAALSGRAFREVIAPLASVTMERAGGLLGVRGSLAERLEQLHSPLDPMAIRLRQCAWATGALLGTGACSLAISLSGLVEAGLILVAPVITALALEQQVVAAASARQERLFLELPVVGEQVGMLLGSGFSLGGALARVAERGQGAAAEDLRRVLRRVRQGLSDVEALQEWSDIAKVPAVSRLVAVFALNDETGDLARLISAEARSIRAEVHRRLAADLDRRSQQVWVPVTVATLVPGTVLLAVPFLQAMQLYSVT